MGILSAHFPETLAFAFTPGTERRSMESSCRVCVRCDGEQQEGRPSCVGKEGLVCGQVVGGGGRCTREGLGRFWTTGPKCSGSVLRPAAGRCRRALDFEMSGARQGRGQGPSLQQILEGYWSPTVGGGGPSGACPLWPASPPGPLWSSDLVGFLARQGPGVRSVRSKRALPTVAYRVPRGQ